MVVKSRRSLADSSAEASERLDTTLEAVRALDRAAAKGILHRNNVARRKARLARRLAKLVTVAPRPAPAKVGKKGAPAKAAEPEEAAKPKRRGFLRRS